MTMKNKISIKGWVTAGIFAALIFLSTYLFHIPTAHGGYVHIGDAIIYLAAALLPAQYAVPCAAFGGALSDALSPGSVPWIIPTIIIKSAIAMLFTSKNTKIICKRNVISIFVAAVISLAGYGVASGIIYGNFIEPILQLPLDSVQPIASGILFLILGSTFDKMKIKQRFNFEALKK
jgi:uncharacterized repeat protein (TIGR04002 family)